MAEIYKKINRDMVEVTRTEKFTQSKVLLLREKTDLETRVQFLQENLAKINAQLAVLNQGVAPI